MKRDFVGMAQQAPIVDEAFDVPGTSKKLNRDRPTYGEGPLQALVLGLKVVAVNLYSSHLWREGRLGWRGKFGGFLGLAAPTSYLDFAPYPFDLGGPEGARRVLSDAHADPDRRPRW